MQFLYRSGNQQKPSATPRSKRCATSSFRKLFPLVLPPLNNEFDALLKSTAIVSSIGMLELTRVGMNIVSRNMDPVPVYLTVALFYIGMSALLNLFARTLEKRVSYVKS